MNIEELAKKYVAIHGFIDGLTSADDMRAALTEQAEAHALELRAYEATVQNLEQRIDELTGVRLTVGDGLEVYGTGEAIRRAQAYILMDSSHPSEAKGTARHFASALQVAEARIRELEAQRVPDELRANLIVGCDEITSLCRHLRHGGCDSSDLSGLEEGLSHAIDVASEMISMLAAATKKEGE